MKASLNSLKVVPTVGPLLGPFLLLSHHVAPCHDVATMSHYQFHFGHLLIQGDVLFISTKVWRCLKYTSICPSQGLWRGARLAWPQSFGQPLPLETVLPVQPWDPHRLHMIFYWRVRPTLSDLFWRWNHALCVLIHGFTHGMVKGNHLPVCLSWLVMIPFRILAGISHKIYTR